MAYRFRLAVQALLITLPLAGACASSPEAPPRPLTPVSKLPADQRAILVAYGRDDPEWPRMRAELLDDPGRARWFCENLVLELVRAYDSARLAAIGEVRGPFERARDELVRFGPHAVGVLVPLLAAKDGVVPVVASDVLVTIGEPAILPVADVLGSADPRARRHAADVLCDLPHAGAGEDALEEHLARIAREDADWLVRAQAARALGRRGLRHVTTETARGGLLPVLSDPDPAVAREAAVALAALGDPRSVPELVRYLELAELAFDARGQEVAQEALKTLTGTTRRRDARAWRDLWRERKGALLSAPADVR